MPLCSLNLPALRRWWRSGNVLESARTQERLAIQDKGDAELRNTDRLALPGLGRTGWVSCSLRQQEATAPWAWTRCSYITRYVAAEPPSERFRGARGEHRAELKSLLLTALLIFALIGPHAR